MGDTDALAVIASILAALVALDQNPLLRIAASNRHQQSLGRELRAQRGLHGPAYDLASVEVQHHRQVQSALPGSDVGDAGHPDLDGSIDRELALQMVGRNG